MIKISGIIHTFGLFHDDPQGVVAEAQVIGDVQLFANAQAFAHIYFGQIGIALEVVYESHVVQDIGGIPPVH